MLRLPKNTVITKESIKRAIQFNEDKRSHYTRLDNYYDGEHEILKRVKPETLANNKQVINHAEYITDTFVGYLLANPVEYKTDGTLDDEVLTPILTEYKKQTIKRVDTELATNASIFGVAYEYVYVNEQGDIKSRSIDPRNCIVVRDDSMEENVLFALTYSEVDSLKKDNYKDVIVYDSQNFYEYNEKLELVKTTRHYFGAVPIIEYKNKRKYKGDFEKVLSLIDAYNLLQSDRLNDKEQFVNALLMFYGFQVTDELMASARVHKTISVPPKTEGTDAGYLVKQLDEADLDILRDRIEQDIHKISKTPNMSDRNFIGNSSGVAISFKLLPFEWATVKKEDNFEDSLKTRFTLYNTHLNKKNKSITLVPKHALDVVFHRGLPRNDFETSQMVNNLSDFVDTETLIGQLSFIPDASVTMEKKKQEKEENMRMGAMQFGTNQPSDDNTDDE